MKNILVTLMLWSSFGVFADEYYFVCNELDDDLEITSYEKVLIINTKEKYIKFNNVKHADYFKNTDLIVEASDLESIAENGSILNFDKISGRLTHYFYGVNFYKCTKANKLIP
tara:strand:+ start:208 stop:546 length:339 start_codon:yes stop_codon:yes gene_type:complete